MICRLRQGRRRRRPQGQRPPARVLRLRDQRRARRTRCRPRPMLRVHRAARRRVPPADGPDARRAAERRARRGRSADLRPAGLEPSARGTVHPSASPSSAVSARSGATAWCSSTTGRLLAPRLRPHVPRCRHARHRPRAARLHLPARERRSHRGRASPPTATRTTSAACPSCCATCRSRSTAPPLTLGLARSRIEEAGLLGRTELITVRDGERRAIGRSTSSSSPSPTRCRTASPPRSTRRRASSCTRATSSSTSPRSTAGCTDLARIGAIADDRGHPPAAVRLHQRRGARATRRSERDVGDVLCDLFHAARGPPHHHRLLRQPHPPHPADRRRRHRVRPGRRHARAVDAARTSAWPATWDCCASPTPPASTSRRSATSAREGLRHLHRRPGRADVGAGAAGVGREPVAQDRPTRTRSS